MPSPDHEIGATQRPSAFDDALDALADRYRRRLLVSLLHHNPQDDADEQLPADVSVTDTESEVLQSEMIHRHLPKLDDLGFIEWDRDAAEIAKGRRFEELRPLLELLDTHRSELPNDWL